VLFLKQSLSLFFIFCLATVSRVAFAADGLRIAGSEALDVVVAEAAPILRSERGLQVQSSTSGGSGAGVTAIGEGTAEVAISLRPITAEERAEYPRVAFTEIYLGEQVVALGVARDVWDAGVHALSRDQLKAIYESKVTNWSTVGGPDRKIVFFNVEEGRGMWELFAQWLYGNNRKAPAGKFPTISGDAEARNTIEFIPGAMTLISPLFVDGQRSYALEIKTPDGKSVAPTPETLPDDAPAALDRQRPAYAERACFQRFHAQRARPGAAQKARFLRRGCAEQSGRR
jgi:phosphate transport system substrate-binding protein